MLRTAYHGSMELLLSEKNKLAFATFLDPSYPAHPLAFKTLLYIIFNIKRFSYVQCPGTQMSTNCCV